MNTTDECTKAVYQGYYNVPLLALEKNFNYEMMINFIKTYWPLSLFLSIIYLVAIRAGEEFMRSRPAFDLRRVLFWWNTVLALFSIFATSRVLPAMVYMIRDHGFASIMCSLGVMEHRQTIALWATLFSISKLVELGDTAFIILRKQRLIFLHWYHHISVMVFSWYTGAYASAMGFPFFTFNYVVHSFMYTYFALKALKLRIPRTVSMMVTSLQILQMVLGISITLYVYWNRTRDPHSCCAPDEAVVAAMLMYGSFFLLFVKFFVDVYWRKVSIDQYSSKKTE